MPWLDQQQEVPPLEPQEQPEALPDLNMVAAELPQEQGQANDVEEPEAYVYVSKLLMG